MSTFSFDPARPVMPAFTQWAAAISLCWLGIGAFALALTPVPAHTAEAGWSPAFWLLLAPACALAGLALRRPAERLRRG